MKTDPEDQFPFDESLENYMEGQALVLALALAKTEGDRARVRDLMTLREDVMRQRAAFRAGARAKRHARGERYGAAELDTIRETNPSKEELDASVRETFQGDHDVDGVLKNFARVEFVEGLALLRNILLTVPDDVKEDLRAMIALEEAFAQRWLDAIRDDVFKSELALRQRRAAASGSGFLRLELVSRPPSPLLESFNGAALGEALGELDHLAMQLGVAPLSTFAGTVGQADADCAPASDVLPTVQALLKALPDRACKIPAKKSVQVALADLEGRLSGLVAQGGRVYFDLFV